MSKLNISKEEFANALNKIKLGIENQNQANIALQTFTNGHSVFTIGDIFLETAIHLLELAVYDKEIKNIGSTISWWLYDSCDKIITIDPSKINKKDTEKKVFDCTTPEGLYDFFEYYHNL